MPIQTDIGNYRELLARAMAQARTPIDVPFRRPVVRGGGPYSGTGTISTETGTTMGVSIDLKPWLTLFGYHDTETLTKWAKELSDRVAAMDPEERQLVEKDPLTSTLLWGLDKRGVPIGMFGWTMTGERTPSGKPIYKYVGTIEEKYMSPQQRAEARVLGGEAAARLWGTRETLATEGPEREARIRESEARATEALARAGAHEAERQRIAEQTKLLPEELELLKLKQQVEKETIQLRQQEMTASQEERALRRQEMELRRQEIEKHMRLIDLQIAKVNGEMRMLETGIPKEERRAMLEIDKAFDSFRSTWATKTVGYGTDESAMFRNIIELESAVRAHVSGMHTYSSNPVVAAKASERSVRVLFGMLDREFQRPSIKEGKGPLGILGGESQATVQQRERRQYYVRIAAEILKDSRVQAQDLYRKLYQWANLAGIDYNKLEEMLR